MSESKVYKVVVNGSWGGFGVSEEAVDWLLANGASSEKVRVQDSGLTSTKWVYTICNLERHDPILVKMVETLGPRANSENSSLVIVTMPQPLYRISDYDGAESLEQPGQIAWEDASKLEG